MKITITVIIILVALIGINGCHGNASAHVQNSKSAVWPEPQQSDFDGIYQFRIDKTTIKDLDTMGYKYREMTVKKDIDDVVKERGIQYVGNWELLCDSIREFKLDDFYKGNISYRNATLIFDNNRLIEFESSVTPGMDAVLEAKYPNYEISTTATTANIEWHNKSIDAWCYFESGLGEYFTILDEYYTVTYLADKKKAEYLKKMNANI